MRAGQTGILAGLMAGLADGTVRVVDLTQTLDSDFPVISLPPEFGQSAPFSMQEISAYDDRGPAWKWHNIAMGEHTGTHFDAPNHWITGRDLPGGTVDQIDPALLVGPAVVIDCAAGAAENDDFVLTPEIILQWEDLHGPIPAGTWVLMRTDWSRRRGAAYLNLREDGPHSPGPTPEAIRLLVHDRDIRGFGTETIGTDAGQGAAFTPPYPAHSILHGAGKFGLQCLCNLDLLPPTGAVLFAPPLKIRNGTGSPLRVLALVEDQGRIPAAGG
jgi:kynurenine formamidase